MKYAKIMNWYINQHDKDVERLNDLHKTRIKNLPNYSMKNLKLDYEIKLLQLELKKLEMIILEYKVQHANFLINIKKDEKGVKGS